MSVMSALELGIRDLTEGFIDHLYGLLDADQIEHTLGNDVALEDHLVIYLRVAEGHADYDLDTIAYVRKNPHVVLERIGA